MADNFYEKHIVSDPSRPYIYHSRMSNCYFLPHWHENIELLFFHDGQSVICDREIYRVKAGDIAIFAPNSLHSIPQEMAADYECLIIDTSFLTENNIDVAHLDFECVVSDKTAAELFAAAMREISAHKSELPFGAAGAKAAILTLMVYLCRSCSKKLSERETSGMVRRAIGYINSNLSRPMTIKEIAESITVSKYYFCREFRRETGFTVVRYINDLRCREAERLLRSTDATVGEIARSLGYENQSYFTRTFKLITGKKPSELRTREPLPTEKESV